MRELKIAYGSSCYAKTWSNKTITFDALCERLKTTIRTPETVEEYPKLSKAERDRAKDHGGFVGGWLGQSRRKAANVECRSMLTHDIDSPDPEFLERYRKQNTYTSCLYSTHSHTPESPRYRIITPLTRDVSPEEYLALTRYLAQEIGIDCVDNCSYRAHQLMYWPTTPSNGEYLFERFDGVWLDPDKYLAAHPGWHDVSLLPTSSRESTLIDHQRRQQADPLTKLGIVGAFCRTYSIEDAIDTFLADVYQPSALSGRYDYVPADSSAGVVLYDGKFAYSHHTTDPASGQLLNAFDLVRIHKFRELDDKAAADTATSRLPSYKAMCDFASQDGNVRKTLATEKLADAQTDFTDFPDIDWTTKLEYESRSNELKNNLHNITLILQNDPKLQGIVFNQQLDGMEIKGEVPWEHPSKFWRDADDAQLISYVDSNYGTFSQRNYEIAVTKVSDDRSYHPIREYLAALPAWDGVRRVDTLLIDYLGAEDTRYVRAVTRKTLCAAIRRVREPGIKFDTMLVLNGPQGIGKSTLISKLAGEWFSDSLNLGDTKDKTAAEKLQGHWILEIGELAGLRKAEVETLRSFLSRQNDIYRAAFGRRATPHLRQCIFFGTTNAESGYLRDTTGNRRFWPVKTPGNGIKNTWDLTQEDVDQIWAEALLYANAGERLYLSPDENKLAKDEQRNAMESDDELEGLVREYLETPIPANWDNMDLCERRSYYAGLGTTEVRGTVKRTRVSNLEVWCECFGKERSNIGRQESNKLTAILTKLGWERIANKQRIPLYGPQFVYVPRIGSEGVPKS